MKKTLAFGIVLVLLLACVGAVSANIVKNGGFEISDPMDLWGGLSVPSAGVLNDWTAVDMEVSGTYWDAYEGVQSIDLSGWVRGTISQNLATTPDQLYKLTFAISGNPSWDAPDSNTIRKVKIYWGGDTPIIRTFDTSKISIYNDMKWIIIDDLPYFLATSDHTTLKFEDVSENAYLAAGVALDDIIVVPYTPTTAPEFPSVFLPVTIIIGFLGAVLLIQRTREN
jgi:hypothetical protein